MANKTIKNKTRVDDKSFDPILATPILKVNIQK